MQKIELLAPAKDLQCGVEAINHGADAIYIGAPKFSARAAAGNSLTDIEQLCNYAHKFGAKVHVALNTILYDNELPEAQQLIRQLYEVGTDVLIMQDLGLLQLELPPLELHASTQMDNRTIEKVQLLEQIGFSRVVLARELSIPQMAEIRKHSTIELEAFVHGALCVSYSGRCYLSEATLNRSANRGKCAQLCRIPYSLIDANGETIVKNKHLLSLKDMDRSDFLLPMIKAGISSFKIEGRLKGVEYVKNITAYYRQKLDQILAENNYQKSSYGKVSILFTPDPTRTFHRGKTPFFPTENKKQISQWETSKSIGQFIGTILEKKHNYLKIKTDKEINNGDGFIFFDKDGNIQGFRANKVEKDTIFPLEMPQISLNQKIYRNYDHQFLKQLKNKTAERKIALKIVVAETNIGFKFHIKDERGLNFYHEIQTEKQLAKQTEKANNQWQIQLSKLGSTPYYLQSIALQLTQAYFIPASLISQWRTELVDLINQKWEEFTTQQKTLLPTPTLTKHYDNLQATYLQNILNKKAETTYRTLGYTQIQPAFEAVAPTGKVPLMFCKYCIKYELGGCPQNTFQKLPPEPWFLQSKNIKIQLQFDCKNCEMRLLTQN